MIPQRFHSQVPGPGTKRERFISSSAIDEAVNKTLEVVVDFAQVTLLVVTQTNGA